MVESGPTPSRSVRADAALLIARISMSALFAWTGLEKLMFRKEAAEYASGFGMPYAFELMPLAVLFELLCAAALITGYRVRFAACLLVVWLLVLGPWFHPFWNATDVDEWRDLLHNVLHHFVMIGGMIYVAVAGPGRFALGRKPGQV